MQADVGYVALDSNILVKWSQGDDIFRGSLAVGFLFFDGLGGSGEGSSIEVFLMKLRLGRKQLQPPSLIVGAEVM